MKKMTLKETQNVLLDLSKEFHRICIDNNIPYYMLGGTMLGAIRHKGFIPWDDDMDFGVPRDYFQELTILLQKELSHGYRLKTIYNSKNIFDETMKMEDTRTLIVELSRSNVKEEIGVNIDIFPLDSTNGSKKLYSKNYIVHIIGVLNSMRYGNIKVLNSWRKVSAILFKILFSPFNKVQMIKFVQKFLISKGDYISNLYGYWGVRETVPKNVMGTPTLYVFEDTLFYGPEKYDEDLTSLYGNYKQIPSKDKIHIHAENIYKK